MIDIKVNKKREYIASIYSFFVDLAILFKLVNRIPNATNELKKIVENHIYEMGINTIESVGETAINVSWCSND